MSWMNPWLIKKPPTRIKVQTIKRTNLIKRTSYISHKCFLYIDKGKKKSRKYFLSFDIDSEQTKNEIIDLAKVADGRMPVTMAILHVNSTSEFVRNLSKMFLEKGTKDEKPLR